MAFLPILKWFLGPIGRWVLVAIAAISILGGTKLFIDHKIREHDKAVIAAEKQKQDLANAKQAAKDAEADLKFQEELRVSQERIQQEARKELATALSAQAGRVAPIREQVVSGALPTASADPTILAYARSTKE